MVTDPSLSMIASWSLGSWRECPRINAAKGVHLIVEELEPIRVDDLTAVIRGRDVTITVNLNFPSPCGTCTVPSPSRRPLYPRQDP